MSKQKTTLLSCALILVSLAGTPALAVATPEGDPRISTPEKRAEDRLTSREKRLAVLEEKREKVVDIALRKKKTARYVYGASGPHSFDCSGFTQWVYSKVGETLSHYSGAQMRETKRVKRENLLPGDLLFYGPGGSQHVAMYIGHGKQIGANNPRVGVVVEPLRSGYWATRFAGAGRVLR